MTETTTKDLILVRYLFLEGSRVVSHKTEHSTGLGISLFQDSIEALLSLLAREYDVQIKEKENFEPLFDKVSKALEERGKAPLSGKAEISKLNKARVSFKHYGNLPNIEDGKRYLEYADKFINNTVLESFGTEISRVSITGLIRSTKIRESLEAAIEKRDSGDHEAAVIACAVAHESLQASLNHIFPPVDSNLKRLGRAFERAESRSIDALTQYLTGYLSEFRFLTITGMIDIDFRELNNFRRILPGVLTMMSGRHQIHIRPGLEYTVKESSFCIDLMTRYAIQSQNKFGV